MALYLPIRALNRSSKIRIDNQKIVSGVTSYVDVSKGTVIKDVASHSSIGQLLVVGPLTPSNADGVVVSGAVIDQGASASDLILGVSAGEVKTRSTGVHAAVAVTTTAVTITTADGTNPRIDIVVADLATAAITAIAGTAAAAPVAPAVPVTKVPLASVAVAAAATGLANAVITDIRPRA